MDLTDLIPPRYKIKSERSTSYAIATCFSNAKDSMLLNVIGQLPVSLLVCATGAIKFCSLILSILEI